MTGVSTSFNRLSGPALLQLGFNWFPSSVILMTLLTNIKGWWVSFKIHKTMFKFTTSGVKYILCIKINVRWRKLHEDQAYSTVQRHRHTSLTPKATGSQEALPNQMLKLKMNLFKSTKQQARTQPFTYLRKRITLHDERLESLSNLLNVTLVQRKPFINLHVLIVWQRFVSSLSRDPWNANNEGLQ